MYTKRHSKVSLIVLTNITVKASVNMRDCRRERTVKRILLTLFLLCATLTISAQTYTGQVTDTNGHPLRSVSVLLLDGNGKNVKFTRTDTQGRFSITAPEGKKVSQIAFSSVEKARQDIEIGKFKSGSKVKMEEQVQVIREVKVTPETLRIKGDTLIYSVAGLREKQDRTIEDIIARIPGIKISASGTITYQGKAINKFYVDGKDMMEDSYALLSKNLAADHVDSVEVMRNHQPIKTLQGKTFSENAAINLVLKDGAKQRWVGTIEAGAGATLQKPWDWTHRAKILGMKFDKNLQTLAIYKHNNVGEDIEGEIQGLAFFTSGGGLLSNIDPVGKGKNGFNNSHLVAASLYKAFNEDSNIRLLVTGLFDKTTSESYSEMQYLDIEGSPTVTEDRHAQSYKREIKGELSYRLNTEKVFVNECLKGLVNFDESSSTTRLNDNSLQEKVVPRSRSVSNHLWVGNGDFDRAINLISDMTYSYMPGKLLLYNGSNEELNMKSFTMSNSLNFDKKLADNLRLKMEIEHELDYKNEYVSYNDTIGTDNYRKNEIRFKPEISYRYRKANVSLTNTVTWMYTSFSTDKDVRWVYTPSVSVSWQPDMVHIFRAYYSHSFNQSGFYTVNPLRIYTAYNSASSGTGTIDNTKGDMFTVSFLKMAMSAGINYNISYTYSARRYNHLYESALSNGVYIRESVNEDSRNTSHSVSGSLGYYFRSLRTKAELSSSYSNTAYDLMLGGNKTRGGNQAMNIGVSFNFRPWKIFYVDGRSSYNRNWQKSVTGSGMGAIYSSFSHSLDLYLQPGQWQLKMENTCSHSKDGSEKFNIYSTASLSYKTRHYELAVSCNNLWGENKHEYKSISELGRAYSVVWFRPRELMASITFSF